MKKTVTIDFCRSSINEADDYKISDIGFYEYDDLQKIHIISLADIKVVYNHTYVELYNKDSLLKMEFHKNKFNSYKIDNQTIDIKTFLKDIKIENSKVEIKYNILLTNNLIIDTHTIVIEFMETTN